ncbi:MAG: adenylyltransferase/cytidyltransferase family protein [Chlamydiae bacterium]|nr:adenylyltransferase/cytidyltransferase family protein [Chlamydiota bacterium]
MLHSLQKNDSFSEFVTQQKIIHPDLIEESSLKWKKEGKTIATLNGSFDLLHAGHLEIIYQASLQADILLLGLNSDCSIKKYKSPNRPIIPLQYRLLLIASLFMVDFVTWFYETDPREWLKKVKPNVHVNGIEYKENCIEEDVVKKFGGTLHFVEKIPGLSTSEMIRRVCDSLGL